MNNYFLKNLRGSEFCVIIYKDLNFCNGLQIFCFFLDKETNQNIILFSEYSPELSTEVLGLQGGAHCDEPLQGDEDSQVDRAALADHSNLKQGQSGPDHDITVLSSVKYILRILSFFH